MQLVLPRPCPALQLSQANPRNREGVWYATRAALLVSAYLRALGQYGEANTALMKAHFQVCVVVVVVVGGGDGRVGRQVLPRWWCNSNSGRAGGCCRCRGSAGSSSGSSVERQLLRLSPLTTHTQPLCSQATRLRCHSCVAATLCPAERSCVAVCRRTT